MIYRVLLKINEENGGKVFSPFSSPKEDTILLPLVKCAESAIIAYGKILYEVKFR